jgi:hypothetical protein
VPNSRIARAHSDPVKGVKYPSIDGNGNCRPCRVPVCWIRPGNAHGSTSGSHWECIIWNLTPSCFCIPDRINNSGNEPPPANAEWL